MMTGFATALLVAQALFAAYTAWLSLSRPTAFAGLLGLTLAGASGTNEIRSQYGGFFLAMAVVQGLAVAHVLPLQTGLLVGAMTFGGLAIGRIWSIIADRGVGGYTPTIRLLLLVDPLAFMLSVAVLAALQASPG
jgi:hypothetical protein